MAKTKTTTPLYPQLQIYFGDKPINIEKNLDRVLSNNVALKKAYQVLHGQATTLLEQRDNLWDENVSLREQVNTLATELGKEKAERGAEKAKLQQQVENANYSLDKAWNELKDSRENNKKTYVYLGNHGTNPPLYSLNQLKWLLRKHDKPATDADYYTLYDLLWERDKYITEIKQLRADLLATSDKLKVIASIDPRTTPEHKLLQVDLEKWTNVFPNNIYPTPNDVAKKITDLQTDLATKTSISLEDQKKIDGYDALKLERDNLKIRRDNWKAKFENAELKPVDLPVNWKTELARIPDLEKRPDIPISKSDWENDWSKRPTLTDYNNLLANQKELDKTVKKQKEQIDKLTQQLGKEQEQSKDLRTNTQTLTNENKILRQKIKDLENQENENLKKTQTLTSLKVDVDNILAKWKASNLAQLSSNIETTISKRNQFQLEIKKLEKEKTENKKTIDDQAETIRKLQQEIIDLKKLRNENTPNAHELLLLEEARKELEEIKKELREQKGDLEPKGKKTGFDLFGSNTIEQWIEQWKKSPSSTSTLIPNSDKLFFHLEKHGEYYNGKYTWQELNGIFEKLKEQIAKEEEIEENDPQKLKAKIKSLKEEIKKYQPDEDGFTNKLNLDKEKQLTKEIDRLERKLESIKKAERISKIREIPRSINGWFKEFQITQPQLDKLHKLNELGIINTKFDDNLYNWQEVEEMLKKSLPFVAKKQNIKTWWIEKTISDEDYLLLKKKGVDVDSEEFTQKEVWEIVDKYDVEPTAPEEKQTFKGWHDKGVVNQDKYNLLVNDNVDPNQEFTLAEIREKLKEISERPVPTKPQPAKKQTIYKWFMEKKIMDEDYILLKKAGVDVEKEEMTLAKVNKLIVEHDK